MITPKIFVIFLALVFALYLKPNRIFLSSTNINRASETPRFIQIPSLQINLPVEVSKIKDNQWLVTNKKSAFFGEKSAFPGGHGATVIFAHATSNLFALLPMLKEKDVIVIQTIDMMYSYQVKEKKIVDPSDVFFLNQNESQKNELAIFTCFGFNDAKRIIFFATLQNAIPIHDLNKSDIKINKAFI